MEELLIDITLDDAALALAIALEDESIELATELSTEVEVTYMANMQSIYTAGQNLSSGNLLMLGDDARVYKNDPTDEANYGRAIGFAKMAVVTGEDEEVITEGVYVEGGFGLTPGAVYYAGLNGSITATPPEAGMSQVVGVAKDADTLVIEIQEPIIL